ncbi:hypothetical protein ES319_D04G057700v1 [Gossypium barbadense]|uniref:Uncharacterized protein n=1 Tax=Gossypium barbadense TaxID=3634 RepID=A0A5J5RSB6_GOSBA|nr:hypothetical protein ES319_D04G057700v1 [Gossypium barbadense]
MMKKLVFKIGFAVKIEYFRPSHSSSTKLVGQKVRSGGLYRLLQFASKRDKAGVIQELDKGVEPNGADYDRRIALHLAACEGWIEVVDLFLEKGADVNYLDHCGRTPLSDAHSFRHNEVCKILEARGGIDPVGMDSQAPCFEIDHNKVNMEEATRIEEWTLRGLSIGFIIFLALIWFLQERTTVHILHYAILFIGVMNSLFSAYDIYDDLIS